MRHAKRALVIVAAFPWSLLLLAGACTDTRRPAPRPSGWQPPPTTVLPAPSPTPEEAVLPDLPTPRPTPRPTPTAKPSPKPTKEPPTTRPTPGPTASPSPIPSPAPGQEAVCHKGYMTLELPPAGITAHLKHGDKLGACS